MSYTQTQWLLLFYAYSVIGWIWETCYVSACQRRFVNRGFLYGPWLPIYGSGAIIILWATLPVQYSMPLVYLFGMLSATALELVTGAVMERLFQMRYWDYSHLPLNLFGYVCLPISLAWGVFSLLLVRWVQPPVLRAVCAIPAQFADLLVLILTVLFVVDATRSVQAALDLRDLMRKLTGHRALLRNAETRFQEMVRRAYPDLRAAEQKLRQLSLPQIPRKRGDMRLPRLIHALHDRAEDFMQEINAQITEQSASAQERARLDALKQSLSDFASAMRKAEAELLARRKSDFRRAASILKRNPSAASRIHSEALAELHALSEDPDQSIWDE